jgi:ERCC4-type nuclease
VYIIEGGLSQLINPTRKENGVFSNVTLQFIKGFSVVKTTSINETAEWICFNAIN